MLLRATKPQLPQTRAQPQPHYDSDSNANKKAGRDHGDDSDDTSSDSDSEASSNASCLQELHGTPLADILRYVDMEKLRSFVEAGLVRIDAEKVYVNFDEDRRSQGVEGPRDLAPVLATGKK